MRIRNQRDFWAGVMFIAFGVGFMVFSQEYQMGTASKMGPAYFPTVLGGILTVLGLAISAPAVRAAAPRTEVGRIDFKALIVILVAIALYGWLLPTMGFFVAGFLLVLVSAWAGEEFRLVETIVVAVALLAFCWVAFVWGLELQFPVWPVFLTR